MRYFYAFFCIWKAGKEEARKEVVAAGVPVRAASSQSQRLEAEDRHGRRPHW